MTGRVYCEGRPTVVKTWIKVNYLPNLIGLRRAKVIAQNSMKKMTCNFKCTTQSVTGSELRKCRHCQSGRPPPSIFHGPIFSDAKLRLTRTSEVSSGKQWKVQAELAARPHHHESVCVSVAVCVCVCVCAPGCVCVCVCVCTRLCVSVWVTQSVHVFPNCESVCAYVAFTQVHGIIIVKLERFHVHWTTQNWQDYLLKIFSLIFQTLVSPGQNTFEKHGGVDVVLFFVRSFFIFF